MSADTQSPARLEAKHLYRRLDALFAERVLGCKVLAHEPYEATCGCEEAWGPHVGDRGVGFIAYTRSLDAAWEGATKIGWEIEFDRLQDTDLWKVWLLTTNDGGVSGQHFRSGAEHSHPAEALVLACLRACGVGEEELG